MVLKMVGVGSQYGVVATDANGAYLDGSKTYKFTVDADVPAKDFWSMVVYDPQTRSELQTDQLLPSKNSKRNQDMVVNADGTIDLYFGPSAPEGQEANWIQTVPDKGWFAVFRLYGPLQPWFDKPGSSTTFSLLVEISIDLFHFSRSTMTVFKHLPSTVLSALFLACSGSALQAADVMPKGYNTPIPVDVLTPDSVTTRIGTFNYFDGFPDDETMRKARRQVDLGAVFRPS